MKAPAALEEVISHCEQTAGTDKYSLRLRRPAGSPVICQHSLAGIAQLEFSLGSVYVMNNEVSHCVDRLDLLKQMLKVGETRCFHTGVLGDSQNELDHSRCSSSGEDSSTYLVIDASVTHQDFAENDFQVRPSQCQFPDGSQERFMFLISCVEDGGSVHLNS